MRGLTVKPHRVGHIPCGLCTTGFEALQCGLIGPDHPALLWLMPAGLQPAPLAPLMQGRVGARHRALECREAPLMGAQPGAGLPAGLAHTPPPHQLHHGVAMQGAVWPRGADAFLRQTGGALDRTVAFSGQRPDALTEQRATERMLQEALEQEQAEVLGRSRYERRGATQGYRNGYEDGTLNENL